MRRIPDGNRVIVSNPNKHELVYTQYVWFTAQGTLGFFEAY